MEKELKVIIESDIFRHYGNGKKQFLWKIRNTALYCTIIFRKAHYYSTKKSILGKLKEIYYRYCLNKVSRRYLFQIPYCVNIGKGLNIVHFGRIIIAPTVIIGENCNIFTGVTIGSTVRGNRGGGTYNREQCLDWT